MRKLIKLPALPQRKPPNPTKEMPFTQHLDELRSHLMRVLIYVMVTGCLMWSLYDRWLEQIFVKPIERAFIAANMNVKLVFTHFLDPLFFKLQVVATAAVLVTLPFILWEIWRFIAPGLHKGERKNLGPMLPFSVLLAFAGCGMVYVIVPFAVQFLLQFVPKDQAFSIFQDPQKYYYFFLRLMLGSAIAFQSPLVFMVLGKLELVSSKGMVGYWRHAVLVNFVVAALITPTIDPFNMSLVALPLCFLYFLSVVLVWFTERGRRLAEAAAALARERGHELHNDPPAEVPVPRAELESAAAAYEAVTAAPVLPVEPDVAPVVDEYGFDAEPEPGSVEPIEVVDRTNLGPDAAQVTEPPKWTAPQPPTDEALFDPDSDD
ncbi:MAG: twin-arginine translocase subunit TatC [Armatimonadetes bacterium]|nr:twin-arginine translocase subunit TatC [Armatimonadota bacterium]